MRETSSSSHSRDITQKKYHCQNSCYKSEFKYTKAEELDSLPYTAKLDVYGGGGYVYRLNSPQAQIKKDLLELQQQHWINNHTRAVFLEFSVYNAQVTLHRCKRSNE